MIRRGIGLGGRLAAVGLAMALVLSLAGDRGRAATVPAIINGQDPLEVLSLKIRPNIIIVLDSSGSMTRLADEAGLPNGDDPRAGDHPRSKMLQAKQVLRQVIAANETKASFQFGTYTQFRMSMSYRNEGDNRFQYVVDERDFPSMQTGVELTVRNAKNDTGERGLQSWQIIYPEWSTLYFQESVSGPDPICAATLPGPLPKFYRTGDQLAADLEAAMDSAPGGCSNNYNVTYDEWDGDFNFSRQGGGNSWRIRWGDGPNNIRNALAERSTSTTSYCTTCTRSTDEPWTLLYRTTGYGDSNADLDTQWTFEEEIPPGSGTAVEFFQLRAGKFFNGEVIRVEADGEICDLTFPTAADKTNPPSVTVQLVANGCGADDPANRATFSFGGGRFGGNNVSCSGFRSKSSLIPCDLQSPPAPSQIEMIGPYIDNELPLDANGDPADWDGDGNVDYVERMDGGWEVQTINVAPSAKASGSTPIANSLIDIKGLADGSNSCITNATPLPGQLDDISQTGTTGTCNQRGFTELWNNGQAGTTVMAGPGPWQLDPISNHVDPKEKTIVLFVTDGDDTCGARNSNGSLSADNDARRAAYYAERLYQRIDPTEPASSVQTYVIGFGGAWSASGPYRLNWIAWGGSGLGQNLPGQPDIGNNGNYWTEGTTSIANKRAQCTTCEDAFIAPDAATLAATIQGIIDQGASEGEFSAQQSVTESIFEYAELASNPSATPPEIFDARNPNTRYLPIVPTRIISSFTLPGFRGQLKAYQNDGAGNSVLKWSAGDVLQQQVANGMTACLANGTTGALTGECSFEQLHGNASDSSIATSSATIKRRIYTTSRNGVYSFDAQDLEAYGRGAWTPTERVTLWPPDSTVAPTNGSEGLLDEALGLPLDSTATPAADFTTLQNEYGACVGANRPNGCTSGSASNQMKAARKEARDMILAFMAGAQPANDGSGGPKRAGGNSSGVSSGDILYTAKAWVLADSELATPAVVTQPLPAEPIDTTWLGEYSLYVKGAGDPRPNSDQMIRQGFGLRDPDEDGGTGNDSRDLLKPVMTVVYAPANDMLHAFRAGPCYTPLTSPANCSGSSSIEDGGEELWGFVPFDQLGTLRLRFINDPQGIDNHVYSLARGVRYSDVFVAADSPFNVTVGGDSQNVQGVWRRILYVPRGIGGKHVTALDVTGPGPYTVAALDTAGPIPLWSRGNPDTDDGTATGIDNGSPSDRAAYAEMGETWSIPAVVFRNKTMFTNTIYDTARRPNGVDYILYMGSGFGGPGEGSTFYTLDALSGDVIAAVDVEAVAQANGLDRTALPYPNALVANAVGFNKAVFVPGDTVHPSASSPSRVYIGDVHGRLWKFLTARPEIAIPVADVGEDQPIGTAVSLLGLPPAPDTATAPFVYAVSGNDRRADGPFNMFGFEDTGTDTQITIGAGVTNGTVTTFSPMVWLHTRQYDQGVPLANCGYTEEAVFRGTIQPATALEDTGGGTVIGRVFFGGTRLNLPNTVFAPPTPLACGTGDYPCRSSFDSIIYALGAKSGQAAYDLNSSGDDAYRIFRDNRIAAISMLADPDPASSGSTFATDEGEMKTAPKPPPPPGIPPTTTAATANVVMQRLPGEPPPSVHYGSTVCQ